MMTQKVDACECVSGIGTISLQMGYNELDEYRY